MILRGIIKGPPTPPFYDSVCFGTSELGGNFWSVYPNQIGLPGQESNPGSHEHGGDPPASVDPFVQKYTSSECVADERQGSGRGCDQAYISPGKREQQTEEGERHEHYTE